MKELLSMNQSYEENFKKLNLSASIIINNINEIPKNNNVLLLNDNEKNISYLISNNKKKIYTVMISVDHNIDGLRHCC